MLKIYHNPRCSKSRAGLQFITDNSLKHEVVDYMSETLTPNDIKELIAKTGLKPFELIRTHEDYYKNNLKGKNFTDEEWYKILADNPKLLHRPIVVNGEKAVFAQPPENINKIL
jgi:arsenate reductase (glutaredoxin)